MTGTVPCRREMRREAQGEPRRDGVRGSAGRMAATSSMLAMICASLDASPRENIIRAPGDIAVRSPARWRPRILNALWFGRSVRAQLLIVFIMIEAIAALVAGGVTIFKAGAATRIEIAASMRLAELMVSEAVQLIQQGIPAEQLLRTLPVQLRSVRHVRIGVRDAAGVAISDRSSPPRDEDRLARTALVRRPDRAADRDP